MSDRDIITDAIERLKLDQLDTSDFLDVDERTIRRWSATYTPQTVKFLLALMIHFKLSPERVSKIAREVFP